MRSARHQRDRIGGKTSGRKPRRAARPIAWAACGSLGLALLGGCSGGIPLADTKSFIDPGELGRFKHDNLTLKIMDHVDPGIEEPNNEFLTAVEPTSQDLVYTSNDYVVSKNDLLSIEISDLTGPGTQTVKQTRVTESGNISLPYLGSPIHAEGLTESQLEQTIVERYRVENIIQRAQVSVQVVEARGRAFSILGAVARPGQYAIVDPEFKVLDALTLTGDTTSPILEDLYVIRHTGTGSGGSGGSGGTTQPSAAPALSPTTSPTRGPAGAPDDLAPRGAAAAPAAALARNTLTGSSLRDRHVIHLDALANPGDVTPGATGTPGAATPPPATSATSDLPPAGSVVPAATSPAAPSTQSAFDPLAPGVAPLAPAPTTSGTDMAPGTGTAGATGAATTSRSGFDGFHELTAPADIKIIHIPLKRLKNGELQYNIVIKPRDTIIVQSLPTGVYYVGGHVVNPGAYTLSGQKVTLKQAIISAHMLDQLAIPQRTDLIRRLGPGKEVFVRVDLDKIFAGHQADIFLKPDDQIMVGTNALAPFLSALRGAFRITYGFGFLYDRNFAINNSNGRTL